MNPDSNNPEQVANLPLRSERDEVNLLKLLAAIARRKGALTGVTLGAMVVASLVTLFLPNRYTATAKILPPQENRSLTSSLMGQLSSLGTMGGMAQTGLGLKNPNEIYIGMLRSRTVESALILRFDLLNVYGAREISDARKGLDGNSSIELDKPGFITISVTDRSAKRAADVANAYVDELRKVTQNLAITEASQRRLFFEEQLEQEKNRLADAEGALKQTQQQTGMLQLENQAKAIIDAVVTQRGEIAAKEAQVRAMRRFATEQNPDLIRVEGELAAMRAHLAGMEGQSGNESHNVQVVASDIPEAGLEYARKLRDVKYHEAIFDVLARQYEAAKLDEAKNAAVIQVLDPAVPPDRKSSPNRTLIVLLAGLCAFVLSAACLLVRVLWNRVKLDFPAH